MTATSTPTNNPDPAARGERDPLPRSAAGAATPSRKAVWAGRVVSGLAVLFLGFDTVLKLINPPFVVEASAKLGYGAGTLPVIGWIALACLVVYLIPRTAVLGAVLWTGYLGGAVATHLRVGDPLFSHILFPTYVAALLWGGLWLRDRRVRALLADPSSFRR
jgi:hypothetical protein